MKIKLTAIVFSIFGLLLGVIITSIAINMSAGKMMTKEMKSPYDYEKTVSLIANRINSTENWHVITVYDMNQEVVKHGGKPIGKYSIIKYCSGKYASEMLMADDRKTMGAMMPKAIAVYEKTDGQVYVATSNGAVMGKLYGGEAERIIEEVSLEIEDILRFVNYKYSIF